MYDLKGRIGLLVPQGNVVMETEFHKMAPEGVTIITRGLVSTRHVPDSTGFVDHVAATIKDNEYLEDDAKRLPHKATVKRPEYKARINVVVFGCTSRSFVGGVEGEKSIIQILNRVLPDIPAVTASGSVVAALKELKIKKLAVGTPYVKEIHARLLKFIEESGFDVVNSKWIGLFDINSQTPERSYNLAKEVDSPEADAIFISCTAFRTIENIERLEKETGKIVITSSQVSMWNALKKIGHKEPIKGYGKLLTKF